MSKELQFLIYNTPQEDVKTDGELIEETSTEKISALQKEGTREVRRSINFYNLDAVISVGYRVNSAKATQFRIWATKTLKEFIQKGFVIDDERLKQGTNVFGKDYFRELLERVRSIRASERRIWQQRQKVSNTTMSLKNNSVLHLIS
jgi:hypothetical protein